MENAIQILMNTHLHDLNPVLAGKGICAPGFSRRAINPDYVLMHYVFKGCGTLFTHDNVHPVHQGQAFLIQPGDDTAIYTADQNDPWEYGWIGFTGELSYQFSSLPPVFDLPEELFSRLKGDFSEPPPLLAYELAGDLFHLYCHLLGPGLKKLDYVQQIAEYVRSHYMQNLSVEDFAKQYNMDRRYMSLQFRKKTGLTVRQYISKIRIDEAKKYLAQGYSSKETSSLCGYGDCHNFYKAFKKETGRNPSDYKRYLKDTYHAENEKHN